MTIRTLSLVVRRHRWLCGVVLTASLAGGLSAKAIVQGNSTESAVAYPEGYRTWFHVKSVFETKGVFHHIYANPEAVVGYQKGAFPDGSIIVVDWLESKDENGQVTETARQRFDVMVKDKKRFAATGGWGFERFKGNSRTDRMVTSVAKQCFECHAGPGTRDLVFSTVRP